MNKLAQLRARLANLKAQGSAKVGELKALEAQIATLQGAALADAEAKATALEGDIDTLASEVGTLTAEIAEEERKAATRATREAAFGVPAAPRGGAGREAFGNEPGAGASGFVTMADFATAVRAAEFGTMDPRLAALPGGTFHNGGSSGEGYLVPPEFRDTIWEVVTSDSDLLARTDVSQTQSNSVSILKDETTPWGATGIVASWRAEGAQMDARKFATKPAQTHLHELYALTLATDEVLEDAPLLAGRLSIKAGQAIAWKASEAIMWGDGVGKPLGWMNSRALVTVAKEPGQSARTILAENVANMYSRVLPANLGGAVWFANSEILPQLVTLKIGNQPIWTPPSAGLANAPGGFLMGRPVEFNEHCEALGAAGDLQLVDLKGYMSVTKASGVTFAHSIHLYFDRGLQAFRWTFRMGGQPYLSAPVAPAKGGATKSHFVALGARA